MKVNTLYLADESATETLGRLLADATKPTPGAIGPHATLGGRIFLSGHLGAGKTTFTRGLLRGYGHQGAVKSPTYTLVEPYELTDCSLYHFDLYRLSDPEEVEFLGVSDYFDDANLCIVEWPEKGKGHLPCPDLEISLVQEGTGRRATWQVRSPKGDVIGRTLSELVELQHTGIDLR